MDKKILREEMKKRRKGMLAGEVIDKSNTVQNRLLELKEFEKADVIAFYVSKKSENEVGTEHAIREALSRHKKIVVPASDKKTRRMRFFELKDFDNDLIPREFGILEPKCKPENQVDADEINLVVTPGVSFDVNGNRVGYGFGYYDNFLRMLKPGTSKIGLAYDFQVINRIESSEHDMPVDKIITERRVIDCRRKPAVRAVS